MISIKSSEILAWDFYRFNLPREQCPCKFCFLYLAYSIIKST